MMISAAGTALSGCTAGAPVPPLGLALADIEPSQVSERPSTPEPVAGQDAAQSQVAMTSGPADEADSASNAVELAAADPSTSSGLPTEAPAAGVATDTPNAATGEPASAPVQLAAIPLSPDRTASTDRFGRDGSSSDATGEIPEPLPLPARALPRAGGQGSAVLALAEKPQPIRLDHAVSARRSASAPLPVVQASADPANQQLPGVNPDRLFEIQRTDGLNDNSDIDLDENTEPVQLASLSGLARLAPNGLQTQHDEVDVNCLKPALVRVLKQVERKFGRPVTVTSGYRSPTRNQRASGAKKSLHMFCAAADIQVDGVTKWQLAEYLRAMPGRGGVGTYCHTQSVHIDVGPERDWNWRCRRSRRG